MNTTESNQGSRAAYDYWLGLISQLLGQFGGPRSAGLGTAENEKPLEFPLDQIAKAATIVEQSLQGVLQLLTPALQSGMPELLNQWSKVAAAFTPNQTGDATTASQTMLAPWLAFMSNAAANPAGAAFMQGVAPRLTQAPLQSMSQAWTDMAGRMTGTSLEQMDAVFDRAFGALSDGVGLGPTRKLNTVWRDVVSASMAQQDARTHYGRLVQGAFGQGFQRLLVVLAAKADKGERVDSVLKLIRMWAFATEQAVHDILQSEEGLAATAALIRADLAYRKKIQQMANVLADQFDMASRRELDDAFREIQSLKRELRAIRNTYEENQQAPAKSASARGSRSAKKRHQGEKR